MIDLSVALAPFPDLIIPWSPIQNMKAETKGEKKRKSEIPFF